MNASNQQKVIDAGFTIIRRETHLGQRRIKAKTKVRREWFTLEKGFESDAALERQMKALLELSTVIED